MRTAIGEPPPQQVKPRRLKAGIVSGFAATISLFVSAGWSVQVIDETQARNTDVRPDGGALVVTLISDTRSFNTFRPSIQECVIGASVAPVPVVLLRRGHAMSAASIPPCAARNATSAA